MKLEGTADIAAPIEVVWDALQDPAVLARCIEGVERLDRAGDGAFEGAVVARVGPVRARFDGRIRIEDPDPPRFYRLVGEGQGGAAGFARGEADVTLAEAGEAATLVCWTARPQLGGRLAQLGARLVEGAAQAQATRFFAALKAELEAVAPATPEEAPPADARAHARRAAVDAATTEALSAERGLPGWAWIGGLALLVIFLLVWLF